MAAVLCCISGTPPEEPVVSRKTGHVFERRLIEKHLADSPKCPVTDEPLDTGDLLPIKACSTSKPRPATAQSVPGLLSALQGEWDSLMLETFQLRKQLETTRQELSHSLYQHDAACRVIARLMSERDAARSALAQSKAFAEAEMGKIAPKAQEDGKLPAAVLTRMQDTMKQLYAARKKRQLPPGLCSAEAVARMTEKFNLAPHSTTQPGVLCCVAAPGDDVVTGGADGNVVLLGRGSRKISQRMQAHKKAVREVLCHASGFIVSGGDDCTVQLWSKAESEYKQAAVFKEHTKPVTGLAITTTGDHVISASLDGSWNMYDVSAGRQILSTAGNNPEVDAHDWTCARLHPDGMLLGLGTTVGGSQAVDIWDLSKCARAAGFAHEGVVRTLSFSENGYHMATGSDNGTVKLWDLRKLQSFRTLTFDDSNPSSPTPVNKVLYDSSGQYLAVATGCVRLFEINKSEATEIAVIRDHQSAVTGAVWGPNAGWLMTTGMDRQVRFYEPQGDAEMD
eukprot:TRINITY_DN8725_c0_g1_i1.p1 TRINITY_DN8725_c0_g1~~TRINITY_DN8725_c0_g1_i1.p1  ORF type:complete len:526 (+),score=158.26 TRINITY_DN8725_c0_g1_i1:57-1580(+)